MTDPRHGEEAKPKLDKAGGANVGAAKSPPDGDAKPAAADEPTTSKKLTAEEQMALYEKHLKENDWGHQPC